MKKFNSIYIIDVKREGYPRVFLSNDGVHFTALDKRIAAQLVPDFRNLNEAAQRKRLIKELDKLEFVGSIEINPRIAPASRKVHGKCDEKHPATVEDLHRGAIDLLEITNLFESPRSGCMFLASALTGLRLSSLQDIEPELRSVLEVRSQDVQLIPIIRELDGVFVQRHKKQTGKSICKRITVACNDDNSPFDGPTSANTFRICKKNLKGIRGDLPLVDGLLVLADKHASRKLIESASASTVWAVGFSAACDCAVPLPKSELRAWNPDIIEHLLADKSFIGALLRRWWGDADATWGNQIIDMTDLDVRNDSHFIMINKVNPDYVLRVWGYSALSFLDYLVSNGILTADEVAPFRTVFTAVFFPAPPAEEAAQRDALSPEVFLDAVRLMVIEKQERITAYGAEKTTNRSRILGGWRTIGDEKYLVLLEDEFKKVYPTFAKKLSADMSGLRNDSWLLDLQKGLCDAKIIKKPSAGYRYRYDLIGKGRENTYVLAVHADLIDDKMLGKGVLSPLPTDLPDSEGEKTPETIETQGVEGL